MMRELLESQVNVKNYIISDLNSDLIGLWNMVKDNPLSVCEHYESLWNELTSYDIDGRKKFFGKIRERLNKEHDPKDFMFIMRTTTNGMPRYNAEGDFNNSFHVTRCGIVPSTLKEIVLDWSRVLNAKNVRFINQSYECINPSENDLVYLDPPYANTKGMYFGSIENEKLFDF